MVAPNQCVRRQILIVDDDPAIARLLRQLLEPDGHAITYARNGEEALGLAAAWTPDLILLDLEMPRLGGFEVCRQVKSDPRTHLIPVVIITGLNALETRLQAWELGADDFLTKPFQAMEVVARCRSLMRAKELVDELDSAHSVVFALARAMEAKSRYTQGHTERVTAFALAVADRHGLSEEEKKPLRRGAALHDIGKIAIPDAILNKPGRLTPEEYEIVKQHPIAGIRIVEPLRSIRDAIPMIRWHHERLDGGGYPDGLFGAAIPLLARLLAVADVYDALASERPYRPALSLPECLRELRRNAAGGGLDPELVECFCARPAIPLMELSSNSGTGALVTV
ncbi:MAG TPA: HD domain-containing phosphohydrolase [Gemmataceae bacterium]|jgi:putative two-component system response regulator|nr:HD domain-containing phosphohydrolase [Gemmataceae bacterium]